MKHKTLEQKIGLFFKDRRERKEDEKHFYEILREKGYKDSTTEGLFDNDIDILGRPKKYKITYKFGKIFPQELGRYALIPVSHKNEYSGWETEFLTLIDRREKKVTRVVNSGDRGVHYQGKCKLKPLALVVTDDGEAIVSYQFILNVDNKNPIVVREDIWKNHLFRFSENRIARVKLEEIK